MYDRRHQFPPAVHPFYLLTERPQTQCIPVSCEHLVAEGVETHRVNGRDVARELVTHVQRSACTTGHLLSVENPVNTSTPSTHAHGGHGFDADYEQASFGIQHRLDHGGGAGGSAGTIYRNCPNSGADWTNYLLLQSLSEKPYLRF